MEIEVKKVKLIDMNLKEFCDHYNTEDFLRGLPNRSWGKIAGEIIDKKPVKDLIESETKIKLTSIEKEDNWDKNEAGYDCITENKLKIQVKFRQWEGKTAYSRQQHFSNTRRHSEKNKGYSAESGHIAYSVNEFDCILVFLCSAEPDKRDPKYWSFSCVSVIDLTDPENPNFCDTKISSDNLRKGKEWIKILEELDLKKGNKNEY